MTDSKQVHNQKPDDSKAHDGIMTKTGKTIVDVVCWIPSRLPKWTGIKPFSFLRMLCTFACILFISIFVFSRWDKIKDYVLAKYPVLQTLLGTSSSRSTPSPAKQAPLGIAYFYVNTTSGGWAAQDGLVQKEGFESAAKEFNQENGSQTLEPRNFIYGQKDVHLDVLSEMKELYEKKNIRVFIVTMSEIIKPLRSEFIKWRNTITDSNNRPILIATVTSAPDIADIKNGILRFYVRSEDEAISLAQYTWYKYQPKNVGVFYIDDAYGKGGAETFANEIHKLGGPTPICYPILMDQKDIGSVIARWIQNEGASGACAFVVGYGDMLKRTIEELDIQNFSGHILCVSTITHEKWRPITSKVGTPLVTVVPDRQKRPTNYPKDDYDVVRFCSKLSLLKGLDCARFSQTTSEFVERWQTTIPPPPQMKDKAKEYGLSVIYSTDGDAIIKLNIEEMHP